MPKASPAMTIAVTPSLVARGTSSASSSYISCKQQAEKKQNPSEHSNSCTQWTDRIPIPRIYTMERSYPHPMSSASSSYHATNHQKEKTKRVNTPDTGHPKRGQQLLCRVNIPDTGSPRRETTTMYNTSRQIISPFHYICIYEVQWTDSYPHFMRYTMDGSYIHSMICTMGRSSLHFAILYNEQIISLFHYLYGGQIVVEIS